MKNYLGQPLYSATDLLNFMGCDHASALDMQVMSEGLSRPKGEDDAYLAILIEKGNEHELAYLEKLRAEGKSIVEIKDDPSTPTTIEEKVERTRQAMADGVDVIYQGTLTAPGWHGYSDFLFKVAKPSNLGGHSYEVADTKLARTAKPKHVVQLCVYSEMVRLVQGVLPEHAHVVLGDGSMKTVRLLDYVHYCNRARDRFNEFVAKNGNVTEAERCPHCNMCHWSERCADEWDRNGNLRLVAALSGPQAIKMRAAGITTIDELAQIDPRFTIPKMQPHAVEKLREQARLQMIKRSTGENKCEVILPIVPKRGFNRLPPLNEGDIFFDMEGDPVYSPEGSLEYLFGFHYLENGDDKYKAFWATDRASEREAFEDAVDFITTRIEQYPNAFIYHYAAYEQTALKRLAREYGKSSRHLDAIKGLAQSYGTRENEVDDLLRNQKFVDLYKVVREAVRTSEPAYSLKNLEVFFAEKRTQEIKSGGDSVVAFENWLKIKDDKILENIEVYNQFDCVSTRQCRDWLISLRPDEATWFDPEAEKLAADLEKEKERRADDLLILQVRDQLVNGFEGEERAWRELLGYLLEYHRREARSEWWKFFDRLEPAADLLEDSEAIGGLTVDTTVAPRIEKRSKIWRLNFPPQEFKLKAGDKPVRYDTRKGAGEIIALNEEERWLELKFGDRTSPLGESTSLIPGGPLNTDVMREAVRRYAAAVLQEKEDRYSAVTSLLRKSLPQLDGGVILRDKADQLNGTVDAISRMDRTYLVIQGPPGSGKTFTSAHAIVSVLDSGKRVGVMSMSHKAINNLLKKVEEVAADRNVKFSGIKKSSKDEDQLKGSVIVESDDNDEVCCGDHGLIGGTAWLFSRPEMDRKLDYLFVDEAGQVSLADIVATGLSAKNIVLVGDQMQLGQPTKGKHPSGSGVSGLDYLMGDWATVPDDRGVFLEHTWRLHPKLCSFISDAFYDGKLKSAPCTFGQMLDLDNDLGGTLGSFGLRFVSVNHKWNTQKSEEEAARVKDAYRAVLGRPWTNQRGQSRPMTTEDILVVSPYNMQVNLLRRTLPPGARIGTVDNFQGQEAAVVLVSMAASDADSAPRGIDFLFEKNRLNVALSRARCLSVVFCSPTLLDVVSVDLQRMALVNNVCWANEYSCSQ
jgi:predicted RecB family nuclease